MGRKVELNENVCEKSRHCNANCVCVCQQLHVFKPVTSKAGNSEQYVICVKFKGTAVLTQDHLKKLSTAYGIIINGTLVL